jgi:putative membrane protein
MTMMGWYSGWGWGGWLAMSLTMLVFWGLLAFGVVALVRTLRREDPDRPAAPAALPGPRTESAREILDGRFARGEIDADEYQRRRDLLSSR